jgi:hypothetical protein
LCHLTGRRCSNRRARQRREDGDAKVNLPRHSGPPGETDLKKCNTRQMGRHFRCRAR